MKWERGRMVEIRSRSFLSIAFRRLDARLQSRSNQRAYFRRGMRRLQIWQCTPFRFTCNRCNRLGRAVWQTDHAPVLLPGDGGFALRFSLDRKLCPVRNKIVLLDANVISSNTRLTEGSRKSRGGTMQRCPGDCPLQIASLTTKRHAVTAAPVDHRWLCLFA